MRPLLSFGLIGRLLIALAVVSVSVLAPVAIWISYIPSYGVDVPLGDQWNVVRILEQFYAGDLRVTFQMLSQLYGEHRIFFPLLLLLGTSLATGHNTVTELYVLGAIFILSAAVLFDAMRRRDEGLVRSLLLFAPVAWIVFSPRQGETMLYSYQVCVALAHLGVVAALRWLVASEWRGRFMWLAIGAAILASFSFASGPLVWVVGFGLLALRTYRRSPTWGRTLAGQVLLWNLVGIATWAVYFRDYVAAPTHHSLSGSALTIGDRVTYFLLSAGGPIAVDLQMALIAGVVLLALHGTLICFVLFRLKDATDRQLLGLGLIAFGLGMCVVGTIGRAGLGPIQALHGYYATLSSLALVGAWLIVTDMPFTPRWAALLTRGAVLLVIAIGLVVGHMWGPKVAEHHRNRKIIGSYYVATIEIQSSANLSSVVFWSPSLVAKWVPILRDRHLSLFRSPLFPVPERGATGELAVMDVAVVAHGRPADTRTPVLIDAKQDDTLTILGWAIDHTARRPASGVLITVDGSRDLPTAFGLPSREVGQLFGDERYSRSAFHASFSASKALGPGEHVLVFKVVTADGQAYHQWDRPLTVVVR